MLYVYPPPATSHCFSFLLALTSFFSLFCDFDICLDYEQLTQRFQDVAKMCGHNKIVSCLEGGYGKWARGKNGTTVLDRSLLAENVSSHVHCLVGVQPLRARKDSRSKREGKKSRWDIYDSTYIHTYIHMYYECVYTYTWHVQVQVVFIYVLMMYLDTTLY